METIVVPCCGESMEGGVARPGDVALCAACGALLLTRNETELEVMSADQVERLIDPESLPAINLLKFLIYYRRAREATIYLQF